MGSGQDYPQPVPHVTAYQLTIPAGAVGACVAALREAGATEVHDGPSTVTGREWPGGHCTDIPGGRAVTATFPGLAPDPVFEDRMAQLGALAAEHGGRVEGASW